MPILLTYPSMHNSYLIRGVTFEKLRMYEIQTRNFLLGDCQSHPQGWIDCLLYVELMLWLFG